MQEQLLYNKLEMKCEIRFIAPLSFVGQGRAFMRGIVATNRVNSEGKKTDFASIPFTAFGDVAEKMESLRLQKGNIVILHGSIRERTFNNEKTLQFNIASIRTDQDFNALIEDGQREYHPKQNNYAKQTQEEQPKEKQENPYQFIVNDDDLPF